MPVMSQLYLSGEEIGISVHSLPIKLGAIAFVPSNSERTSVPSSCILSEHLSNMAELESWACVCAAQRPVT